MNPPTPQLHTKHAAATMARNLFSRRVEPYACTTAHTHNYTRNTHMYTQLVFMMKKTRTASQRCGDLYLPARIVPVALRVHRARSKCVCGLVFCVCCLCACRFYTRYVFPRSHSTPLVRYARCIMYSTTEIYRDRLWTTD